MPVGETHKSLRIAEELCRQMLVKGDRQSVLVNIGGGVVTDMGGFVASIFKRGIRYINVPTTLLAMTDAAVGGKTGVNFGGLKNQLGTFHHPAQTLIHLPFLQTLPQRELKAGCAETVKHALVADAELWQMLKQAEQFPMVSEKAIQRSVRVKEAIVARDEHEQGERQKLNFGHTIGHSLEAWSMQTKQPLLHGEAIAAGMLLETHLSSRLCGLPQKELEEVTAYLQQHYTPAPVPAEAVPELLRLMQGDKKTSHGRLRFALLERIGDCRVNVEVEPQEVEKVLSNTVTS